MTDLATIGQRLATTRKTLNLTQTTLGKKAGVSRATIDALENGRARELGFRKISKLLAAAGLELAIQPANSRRPTYDELMQEDLDAQSLDRRR